MEIARSNEVPTTSSIPKLQLEAIQSVMPMKHTEPRLTEKVVVKSPLNLEIFQKCHHILLYYNKASENDSGWFAAGRIKESLGRVLVEAPMFAGRLKLDDGDDGVVEGLQLVANDSGARLVEARLPMTLQEFLHWKEQEDVEAQLVYWEDIDEKNPQFCPLFYVQVTNFQCGGYSIGISCNLILADPLVLTSFLKNWAKLHNTMLLENDLPKMPVFYLPNLKTTNCLSKPYGFNLHKHCGQTLIFNITSESAKSGDDSMLRKLIFLCIERTELKFGSKMNSNFALFMKGFANKMKVEICSKQGLVRSPVSSGSEISPSNWEDLKINEVAFVEGNQPLHVSYWIGLRFADEGLVMVHTSRDEVDSGILTVIVTIPTEK